MADDWTPLGAVEVDSGMLVVGDPIHLLPHAAKARPGLDAQVTIDADALVPAMPIARDLALLLQRFGGDGRYPVYGRFDGPQLVSVRIDFEEPEADGDEDEEGDEVDGEA